MLKNIMQFETKGDAEIVITRLFNAPRQMVWDAHTKPELLKIIETAGGVLPLAAAP